MFAFKSSLLLESQPLTGIALRSPVTPDPFSCSRSVKRLFKPDFPSLLLYYFTMGASFSALYWLESFSSSFARENPQLELPEPTVSNIISVWIIMATIYWFHWMDWSTIPAGAALARVSRQLTDFLNAAFQNGDVDDNLLLPLHFGN